MSRLRSRTVETESVVPRLLRRGSVKRTHIDRWAVGADQLAPGSVDTVHLAPTAVQPSLLAAGLVPRERVVFDQIEDAVTATESDRYPVSVGGEAKATAQVVTAPTTAVDVDVLRNGTSIGTLTIPVSSTQATTTFDTRYNPGDTVSVEVTDAGAGATGLVVVVQLSA